MMNFSLGIPRYLHGLNMPEAELVETVVKGTRPVPLGSTGLSASLQRVIEALQAYKQEQAAPQESPSTASSGSPNQEIPVVLRIQLDVVQGKVG